MKNFIIILLSICLISCKNETVPFDQETSDIINTFSQYGYAVTDTRADCETDPHGI